MELISLVIMALGLVALVAIYILSRISRRDLPQKRDESVPVLRDKDGNPISSVLEDVPARDGKRPAANARILSDAMMSGVATPSTTSDVALEPENSVILPPQLVLFVAADIDAGFAGEEVLKALDNAGLRFGDMGIFHRIIIHDGTEVSLFSVANGVKPWTLVPEELIEQATPGLSMILNLPSPIANGDAIHDFLRTAERLTGDLGGVLKDQDQQAITADSRASLLALAG